MKRWQAVFLTCLKKKKKISLLILSDDESSWRVSSLLLVRFNCFFKVTIPVLSRTEWQYHDSIKRLCAYDLMYSDLLLFSVINNAILILIFKYARVLPFFYLLSCNSSGSGEQGVFIFLFLLSFLPILFEVFQAMPQAFVLQSHHHIWLQNFLTCMRQIVFRHKIMSFFSCVGNRVWSFFLMHKGTSLGSFLVREETNIILQTI